jgi:hypothetical protein
MTRGNAEGLAKAILEGLSAKSKRGAIRKMTVSGGTVH